MSGCVAGRRKPIRLAQLLQEVSDLTQALESQEEDIGATLSRCERLSLAGVGPAHGNRRMGAIEQA